MGIFDRFLRRDAQDPSEAASTRVPAEGSEPGRVLPPTPEELAKDIVQRLDSNAPPATIVEAYAAFERAYPRASLPVEAQLRLAHLLATQRCRLLAIEAFRKATFGARPDDPKAVMAHLALAQLLAQSPATCDEAQRILTQTMPHAAAPRLQEIARSLEERMRPVTTEIYPRASGGQPGARPAGRCCLLAQTAARIPVADLGPLLADRLGLNPLDMKIALARQPGILARDVPAETAERLAHQIQGMGLPVVVVEEARCPRLPSVEQAASVAPLPSGEYRFDLTVGPLDLDPARLNLAQFGVLRSSEFTVRPEPPRSTPHGEVSASGGGARFDRLLHLRKACDLYTFEPLRRIRLLEGRTPPAYLGPPATFIGMAKDILEKAPGLPLNHGLDLLFSDGVLDSITYDSPQAFDNHAEWLFLLAYNGCMGG